jgi:hypothetical protein
LQNGSSHPVTEGSGIMPPGLTIEYTVHIWQEGNQFIAHAMPMDIMSSGLTPGISPESLG